MSMQRELAVTPRVILCSSTQKPLVNLDTNEMLSSFGKCSYCNSYFSEEELVLNCIPSHWPVEYEGEGVVCQSCDDYLTEEE